MSGFSVLSGRGLCLWFTVLVIAGVAVAQRVPETTQPNDIPHYEDLYEVALRSERIGQNVRNETHFIAMGFDGENYIDPTPEFVARFNDLKVPIKPVSKARRPKPGEMKEPGRARGVEDPERGTGGRIYYMRIMKRLADDEVLVDVGFIGGPLYGGGSHSVFKLIDGKWQFQRSEGGWVS